MTSTFGTGYYGIGDYGLATPIPFTGSVARTDFGGGARVVPQPVMRALARSEIGAKSRYVDILGAGGFLALSGFEGRPGFWVGPALHPRARSEFGGSYYFDQSLPDRETLHLCHGRPGFDAVTAWAARITLRAAQGSPGLDAGADAEVWAVIGPPLARTGLDGQSRAILTQPVRLDTARIGLDGRTGPGTVGNAFRRSASRIGLDGRARGQVYAVAKGWRARGELRGTMTARAAFKGNLDIARPGLSGGARMSYTWSDQTAPGRDPAPNWGGVGAPADQWQPTPAQADIWQDV